MGNKTVAGGTLQTCPHSDAPEIVTFQNNGTEKTFDRSQCPYNQECTDETCPLCNHLNK